MPRRRPVDCPREPARAAALSPTRFIEFCLTDAGGNAIRQAPVHDELHAFLTAHRHALVELPRDHGKSVQVCARIAWELAHDPGLRVKLVCATAARAADRSGFLRGLIADNPRVRLAFPGLRPGRPWGAEAFAVVRPAAAIDPSVSAIGVGTSSTGGRADLLVCDDIVDAKALHSRTDRQKTKDLFRHNLMNLLEPDGRLWCLFTPWDAFHFWHNFCWVRVRRIPRWKKVSGRTTKSVSVWRKGNRCVARRRRRRRRGTGYGRSRGRSKPPALAGTEAMF